MLPDFQLRGCGRTLPWLWHWMQTSPSGWQVWHDCRLRRASVEWSDFQLGATYCCDPLPSGLWDLIFKDPLGKRLWQAVQYF